MENFSYYNPVRIHFGSDAIFKIKERAPIYGKKALVVYGQGSVKKFNILTKVLNQLSLAGIKYVEYSGIKPNPVIEDVVKASELARKEKVDMIFAIGGGSVLDSAKVIAVVSKSNIDPWEFMEGKITPESALPILTVLTVVGTGSEMNAVAVLQNNKLARKIGMRHELMYPKESFLDPSLTTTVPRFQTACGIADIIAHALEAYFGDGEAPLADFFASSIIREVMDAGLKLVNDLYNYNLRARVMLASSFALNGTTAIARGNSGDWGTHAIGHILSVLYDTSHGATLSIAFPAWMKLHLDKIPNRIRQLGKLVFNDQCLDEIDTIKKFEEFFKIISLPTRLADLSIPREDTNLILQLMNKNQVSGKIFPLSEDDRKAIIEYMITGGKF